MEELIKQEWYELLVDDCKAIIIEKEFIARWSLVECYHEIGKRILEEYDNFNKADIYGKEIVKRVSLSLNKGIRIIQKSIQFATKYPILEKAPFGKNVTIRYIFNELLPESLTEVNPMPKGKYNVIYADPPWEYNNSGFKNSAESNYPIMPLKKICDLPVIEWSTNETVLFLWATNPLLIDAFEVMNKWGFIYKTNFVWVKDKARGWAWWAKSKHESLLVGVKDNTNTPTKNFDSVFFEKRENKHSKKPEYVYEMIETMFPKQTDGNSNTYLELFQREPRPGWDGYGNEL